jgi:hypothetical protein
MSTPNGPLRSENTSPPIKGTDLLLFNGSVVSFEGLGSSLTARPQGGEDEADIPGASKSGLSPRA